MTSSSPMLDIVHLPIVTVQEALLSEVRRGLLGRPRSLAPWMFYDDRGSILFEQITTLPEYYPARTERQVLTTSAHDMLDAALRSPQRALRLVELGAGNASKTCIILKAAEQLQIEVLYMPVDISAGALESACESVACTSPGILIQPVVANYVSDPPQLPHFEGSTIALYLGSSIGNFLPSEAQTILRNLRSQLKTSDSLLLGTDLVKDEATLVTAYDDPEGVTAAFNSNVLVRLNRELNADFDPTRFRHRAIWNLVESRIEMHLESICAQKVHIRDANVDFELDQHETIHTENSYKFTNRTTDLLLRDSGFDIRERWMDSRDWYSVTLAHPVSATGMDMSGECGPDSRSEEGQR